MHLRPRHPGRPVPRRTQGQEAQFTGSRQPTPSTQRSDSTNTSSPPNAPTKSLTSSPPSTPTPSTSFTTPCSNLPSCRRQTRRPFPVRAPGLLRRRPRIKTRRPGLQPHRHPARHLGQDQVGGQTSEVLAHPSWGALTLSGRVYPERSRREGSSGGGPRNAFSPGGLGPYPPFSSINRKRLSSETARSYTGLSTITPPMFTAPNPCLVPSS